MEYPLCAESYHVQLPIGKLPLDRRCSLPVFFDTLRRTQKTRVAKACCLLIPGFGSNRKIFDLTGEAGESFMNHLARAGFDAFSMDVRGSREASALGTPHATGFKEMVEIDLPCTVAFIQKLCGYERVYLIGHSLGAAYCVAYTGSHPDSVQGIVHLAGVYGLYFPMFCKLLRSLPSIVKNPLVRLTNTVESLVMKAWSCVPFAKSIEKRVSNYVYKVGDSESFKAFLKQTIPIREAFECWEPLFPYIPETITSIFFFYLVYPNAFYPYSTRDPLGFIRQALESPSVGHVIAVIRTGFHDEYYNWWKETPDGHGILPHSISEFYRGFKEFEKTHKPILFASANHDGVIYVQDADAGYSRSSSAWKARVDYSSLNPLDPLESLDPLTNPNNPMTQKDERTDSAIDLIARPLRKTTSHSFKNLNALGDPVKKQSRLMPIKSYVIPRSLTFGHADVLASRHANILWDVIVDWLNDTVDRESAWVHARHHSR